MFLQRVFAVLLVCRLTASEDIVVKTKYGNVAGREETRASSFNGNNIITFKNIPYAKPPLGELRFQPPLSPDSWTGTRGVSDMKIFCPQVVTNEMTNLNVTEDCLLLDVHINRRPSDNMQNQLYPVIVYFHGGQFSNGTKDIYGPKYLMDQNLVLVIANYRLGVLGFLSTGDREAPGNYGLRDQLMVLNWVKENIQPFGGNPDKITIFGHDAGAASVSLHILSPLSKGLFTTAISCGGNALVSWALTSNPQEHAYSLAKRLQCSTSSNSAIVKCLREKKSEQLVSASLADRKLIFRPVIDKESKEPFLPDSPRHLYENEFNSVPYICGITENEGSLEFYSRYEEATKLETVDSLTEFFLEPHMKNKSNFDSVVKAAKYHYLPGMVDVDIDKSEEGLINMISDVWMKSANDITLKLHSQSVDSTFMYVFNYLGVKSFANVYGKDNIPRSKYGVTHMDDVFYFFNTTFDDEATESGVIRDDTYAIRAMCAIIKKFADDGDVTRTPLLPTDWKQYSSDTQYCLNYSTFDQRLIENYRQSDMDFWNVFVPDLQAVNNQTSNPDEDSRGKNNKSTMYVLVAVIMVLTVLCVSLAAVVLISRSKATRLARLTTESSHEMTQEKL